MISKLEIATGRSRYDKRWQNKEVTWRALLNKLSKTHRTHETFDEYVASPPDRQDEIKDIGGFVGGHIVGGRRKSGSVLYRSVVTLDLDKALPDTWSTFTAVYDFTACIYSTHKHSPGAPRLRLVVPLDRPASADEYRAIARRLAQWVGIDTVDPTTFQPERLMYWPSSPVDGEFFFDHQEGSWLSADAVLSSYSDWRDVSQWPLAPGEREQIARESSRQSDPLLKEGIVGAFCRAYTIEAAISAFLPDTYTQTDLPDRYTYTKGSTFGGLVVYDHKFAFSHHGTDPASGQLCNAFDLVRIHLFGLQDDRSEPGAPAVKLPSFTEMSSLASKDKAVRIQIGSDTIAAAQRQWADEPDSCPVSPTTQKIPETANTKWMADMEVDKKGNFLNTINNRVLILSHDPVMACNVAMNLFEDERLVFTKPVPWRDIQLGSRLMSDEDISHIENYTEKTYGLKGREPLIKALEIVGRKNAFHPIRAYLSELTWDGRERLDTLLINYMGADDSTYVRTVTRKAFIAAIARVMRPGVKFDYVLTMVGPQGAGKSTLIRKMGGPWFSDSFNLHMVGKKDSYENIQGAWLIEIAELSGMAKAEIEAVKAFISASKDRFRPAYGRMIVERPRQCVFFASTNKVDFLRDQSGNRRFWPVTVDPDKALLDVFRLDTDAVGQLWAEALHRYDSGETLYLDEKAEAQANKIQEAHTEDHPWRELVEPYLEIPLPDNWRKMTVYERKDYISDSDRHKLEGVEERTRVCLAELWTEAVQERGVIDERGASILRAIMRKTPGWERSDKPIRYGVYGVQRGGWVKENVTTRSEIGG